MRLRHAVGAVGALATGLAALAVLGAGMDPVSGVLAPLATALSGLGTDGLVFVSVGLVALALLASALVPGGERTVADDGAADRFERLLDRPPEGAADAAPRTASEFDSAVQRAVEGDADATAAVRDRLRDLATATLARRDGEDTEQTAAERVAAGTWTDDRTAAGFLADGSDPTPSLRSRLDLWLDPETERERRIRRTVAVVGGRAEETLPTGVEGSGEESGKSAPAPARARTTDGRAGTGGTAARADGGGDGE